MPSFLLSEAERLHGIGVKIPALAIALEEKLVASSRKFIESLWMLKLEQMSKEKRKEYHDNPIHPFVDLVLPAALRGFKIEHPQSEGGYSAEEYLKARNLYVESKLPDALELVDFLDYDDLLDYLRFFTRYKIDEAVDYGRSLARDSHKNHKTRMDGTPLPQYPPIKPQKLSIVKPVLAKDTDVKEDKKEQGKSQRPRNVF